MILFLLLCPLSTASISGCGVGVKRAGIKSIAHVQWWDHSTSLLHAANQSPAALATGLAQSKPNANFREVGAIYQRDGQNHVGTINAS